MMGRWGRGVYDCDVDGGAAAGARGVCVAVQQGAAML